MIDDEVIVEVVEEKSPDAYQFTVKARANGLLHRVMPARDPRQPRFWCVVVYRCSPGGVPVGSELPWMSGGGLRREELPEAMKAIRADPGAWLAEGSQRELRDWMLDPSATPPPAPASGRATAAAATSALAAKQPRA